MVACQHGRSKRTRRLVRCNPHGRHVTVLAHRKPDSQTASVQSIPKSQPSPPVQKQPAAQRNWRPNPQTSHAVHKQPGNSCVKPSPMVSCPQAPAIAANAKAPESSNQTKSCTVSATPEVQHVAVDVDHPHGAQQIFQILNSSGHKAPLHASTTADKTSLRQLDEAHAIMDSTAQLDVHSNSPDQPSSKAVKTKALKKKHKQQVQHTGVGVRALCAQGSVGSATGACQGRAGGLQTQATTSKAGGNARQQSSTYMSSLRAKLQSANAAPCKLDLAGVKKKKKKQQKRSHACG